MCMIFINDTPINQVTVFCFTVTTKRLRKHIVLTINDTSCIRCDTFLYILIERSQFCNHSFLSFPSDFCLITFRSSPEYFTCFFRKYQKFQVCQGSKKLCFTVLSCDLDICFFESPYLCLFNSPAVQHRNNKRLPFLKRKTLIFTSRSQRHYLYNLNCSVCYLFVKVELKVSFLALFQII